MKTDEHRSSQRFIRIGPCLSVAEISCGFVSSDVAVAGRLFYRAKRPRGGHADRIGGYRRGDARDAKADLEAAHIVLGTGAVSGNRRLRETIRLRTGLEGGF